MSSLYPCRECDGCGRVGPDGKPWTTWTKETLPERDRAGFGDILVEPKPCPVCAGDGYVFD